MIELTGLTKKYGAFTAVDAIDLFVPKGELFGFLGPNGAGKTTTLRMIAGILRPTAGMVRIAGLDLNANPMDGRDHPFGVWTLPPVRRSTQDGRTLTGAERHHFDAIGESDRMTLRFVRPTAADN